MIFKFDFHPKLPDNKIVFSYMKVEQVSMDCLCTISRLLHKRFSSVTQLCPALCCPMDWARQASLSFIISWSLLSLMSIESVMPSNHLILCHPLLLLPSIFPSIRVISNESALHIRSPKYWSFSFSITHFSEYSGLISFKIEWFNVPAIRDSQESSPTPQFKSINYLALSLIYGPTLTSIHDYWKNHSFD